MKHAAALLCTLLLAACAAGGSDAARYYQLPDSAYNPPEHSRPATAVRILLAEPLKTANMLYQSDAHTLHFARNHLWSAPLDESLAAALSNKLNRHSKGGYLPARLADSRTPVLTVYFDRFQGSYQGHTEISGYAHYPDGRHRPLHILTPQQGDGYAAMSDSLDQGLEEAARRLLP